jgi:hypothetical protein
LLICEVLTLTFPDEPPMDASAPPNPAWLPDSFESWISVNAPTDGAVKIPPPTPPEAVLPAISERTNTAWPLVL